MATIAELRKGLASTTVPDHVADVLLKSASSLWLSSDSAADLAGDLALCHPPLKRSEVRARAVGGDDTWRLTVVAHDRKGLLADTAAILSTDEFCIRGASVTTWEELDIALHSLTIAGSPPTDDKLDEIGAALRAATKGTRPSVPFTPMGRAFVRQTGVANGDAMISVVAPDQKGLLAAICRWFSDAGVSIEAAWITGEGEANDVFVVDGDVDVAALERRLSLEDGSIQAVVGSMISDARKAGEELVKNAADFVAGLLRRN
jgi:predicted amino acid-binding ACT domain protein